MEHILTNEEKKKLSYEFSFEFLQIIIKELQKINYCLYKKLIHSHKLVITKYNYNREDFNKKVAKELLEFEKQFLEYQNLLDGLVKIYKSNINKTNIKLNFKDEDSKNKFLDNLNKRNKLLFEYKDNINKIENYIDNFSNKLQKIYLSNIFYKDN
jgi:hypothetical protein